MQGLPLFSDTKIHSTDNGAHFLCLTPSILDCFRLSSTSPCSDMTLMTPRPATKGAQGYVVIKHAQEGVSRLRDLAT